MRDPDESRLDWQGRAVTVVAWARFQAALPIEAHRWRATLGTPRASDAPALAAPIASVAHVAYPDLLR